MNRKLYGGLAILIILLSVGSFFVIRHKMSTAKQARELQELEIQITTRSAEDAYPFGQRAIRDYPYSDAALAARYKLALYDEKFKRIYDETLLLVSYKEALKYHPKSTQLLADIAELTWRDTPEESIIHGQKALRLLSSSSEIKKPKFYDLHKTLGQAYQKVGNYKAAWVHLKAAEKLIQPHIGVKRAGTVGNILTEDGISRSLLETKYDNVTMDIVAIEDGKPYYEPDNEKQQFSIQEICDFVGWISIGKTESAVDSFLLREIALIIQGEVAQFSSERLIRVYDIFHQHGDTQGIKQLKNIDPELAQTISRYNKHARSK